MLLNILCHFWPCIISWYDLILVDQLNTVLRKLLASLQPFLKYAQSVLASCNSVFCTFHSVAHIHPSSNLIV